MRRLRIGRVVGVQPVALNLDGRVLAQRREVRPVRGRLAPVEQPGLGQDQRAGTDRAEAPDPGFSGPQPGEQRLVAPLRIHADATGDQQGIQRGGSAFGPAGIRHQLQPGRGDDRAGRGAQQHQLVMTRQPLALSLDVGRGEHLHRAGDVQAHHIRVDQAGDSAGGVHGAALGVDGCSLLPRCRCRNDKVPTNLASIALCEPALMRDQHRGSRRCGRRPALQAPLRLIRKRYCPGVMPTTVLKSWMKCAWSL